MLATVPRLGLGGFAVVAALLLPSLVLRSDLRPSFQASVPGALADTLVRLFPFSGREAPPSHASDMSRVPGQAARDDVRRAVAAVRTGRPRDGLPPSARSTPAAFGDPSSGRGTGVRRDRGTSAAARRARNGPAGAPLQAVTQPPPAIPQPPQAAPSVDTSPPVVSGATRTSVQTAGSTGAPSPSAPRTQSTKDGTPPAPTSTPRKGASHKAAPEKAAPGKGAPEKDASHKPAPQKAAPQKAAPEKGAPEKDARHEAAPQTAAPEKGKPTTAGGPPTAQPAVALPSVAPTPAPAPAASAPTAPPAVASPDRPHEPFTPAAGTADSDAERGTGAPRTRPPGRK